MIDCEQIQRDAEARLDRSPQPGDSHLLARHCLALLVALKEAERRCERLDIEECKP